MQNVKIAQEIPGSRTGALLICQADTEFCKIPHLGLEFAMSVVAFHCVSSVELEINAGIH